MSTKREELIAGEPLLNDQSGSHGIKIELIAFALFCLAALLVKAWQLYGLIVIEELVMEHGLKNVPLQARVRFQTEGLYAPYFFYGFMILAAISFFMAYGKGRAQLIEQGVKGLTSDTRRLVVLSLIPIVNLIAPFFVLSDFDRANKFAHETGRGGSVWKLDQFRRINWWVVGIGVAFWIFVFTSWTCTYLIDVTYDTKILLDAHFFEVVDEILVLHLAVLTAAFVSFVASYFFLLREHWLLVAPKTPV